MIGILATVTVQSSSTSTSIVITMVAAAIIPVRVAIPIIMGANIGTSVTNTIVAMTETSDRDMFRRAFGGATVHDMFNWLSVIVLLPLECATGYLYHLTTLMVHSGGIQHTKGTKRDFLKKLTKPLTDRVLQLDKQIIEKIALGQEEYAHHSLVKRCNSYELHSTNATNISDTNSTLIITPDSDKCAWFLLQSVPLSDTWLGLLLLIASLITLCSCLVLLVKILKSVLRGRIIKVIKRVVNADFCGAGYIAMVIGAVMTMLVQSSSIFTSVLTPLVGMNVIKLESMYPLTLGSNVGTTATGMLAAMAVSGDKQQAALQIALVHLFFNLSGILLFYPIPHTRLPIKLAKVMGNTTAKYRWFAALYLLMMFLVLPLLVFGMSLAGRIPFAIFLSVVMTLSTATIVLNILQNKIPDRLPQKLRTWHFLPFEWMYSLAPLDRLISRIISTIKRCCLCKSRGAKSKPIANTDEQLALNPAHDGSCRVILLDVGQPGPHAVDTAELAANLEKKLATGMWDEESGYGSRVASQFASRVPTPANSRTSTPSASVLPSRATSVLNLKHSEL